MGDFYLIYRANLYFVCLKSKDSDVTGFQIEQVK